MLGAVIGFLRRQSLRVWIAVGMALAVMPLLLATGLGYLLYHTTVVTPFREVLQAQHRVLLPLERIQGELWDVAVAVDDYAELGDESYRSAFEDAERRVGQHLAELQAAVGDHGQFRAVLAGAEQQWSEVVKAAAEVQPGDPARADQALVRFETVISGVALRLEDVLDGIRQDSERSHAAALKAMETIEIAAGVAAALSIALMLLGAHVINKALTESTDELIAGANRMAAGDRESVIDVQVPPELAEVARAFNTLASRVRDQEQALESLAATDGLTGLANRRAFDHALAAEHRRIAAEGGSFALFMIDVDHFKSFNDTHGHLAGDDALRHLARIVLGSARSDDRVFRYGGEEFAMILRDLPDTAVSMAAERVRLAVSQQPVVLPGGKQLPMTVSIGVARIEQPGEGDSRLVSMADEALYRAKREGRNRVALAA